MGITITVDLAASTPSDIARAAKFMLEFAGYQDPSVGQAAPPTEPLGQMQSFPESTGGLVGARGSLGEEVADDNGPLSTTAFAAGVGGNLTVSTHLPPPVVPVAAPPVADVTIALPPPPPGIEVDAQGVPWDARIHAGSRAKIADGTWRQRRNLDPEVYKRVMDELRHTMGVERRAPQPPAPPAPVEVFAPHPPVPPVPPVPPTPEADDNGAEELEALASRAPAVPPVSAVASVPPVPFAGSAVPPAPPISSTPPVPVSAGAAPAASPGDTQGLPGSGGAVTFPALMKQITARIANKSLTGDQVNEASRSVGLSSFPMLASRPDLVADVATKLGIAL